MKSPYEIGKPYWFKTTEHDQALAAIVSEVYEHELVLTDVCVHPEGPPCYESLVVGRAAVKEARPIDVSDQPAPRRVSVQG